MTIDDFYALLKQGTPSQKANRVIAFVECMIHLLHDTPDGDERDRQRIFEYMAGARAMADLYVTAPVGLFVIYQECIKFGVPKDKVHALIALHLT